MNDKPFDHIETYKKAIRNILVNGDNLEPSLVDLLFEEYHEEIRAVFSAGVAACGISNLLLAAAKAFHQ